MSTTTVIGASIIVDGEISGEGRLVVQGTVRGRVQVKTAVQVERTGAVDAEVDTDQALISGTVKGRVSARTRVELTPDGRMSGDLKAPRILIADGAQFRGNVDMDERG